MLRLLQHGLIKEMLQLENMHIRKVKRDATTLGDTGLLSPPSGSDSDGEEMNVELEPEYGVDEDTEDFMKRRTKFVKKCLRRAREQRKVEEPLVNFKNTIIADERRRVIKEFLSDIGSSKKCPHCLGYVFSNSCDAEA
jgi:DNA-directed RNA polymerase I subunit RPA1